jgi:PAS domain S-box-containing protein
MNNEMNGIPQCRLACDLLPDTNRYDQLRHAIDQHSIVSATDEHGTIVEVNDKFCAISGYSREELIGQNHRIVKSDVHPDFLYQKMWYTITSGNVWQGTVCNRKKDGGYYWVEATIVPILDENGQPWRYISIRTDITSLKTNEADLITARDEAQAANQAKSLFLSNMSHELRTPLNAILGFGQLLEVDPTLNTDQIDSVQEIINAGRHLLDLVNEVLDLARIESGRLAITLGPVVLDDLVDECLSLTAPLAASRGICFALPAVSGCTVQADRTRLKQALVNLLSNAVKYNSSNGQVRLEYELPDERFIRIHVHDTGIGIAPERLSELFQPFNRLGQELGEVEGTGIGLAITKQLVEAMGGRVGAASATGQGSDFWLELPLEEGQAAPGDNE